MKNTFVIGIAGGSGSGKSTFSRRIKECFGEDVTYISSDNYYYPHDNLSKEQRDSLNYDIPDAIEFSLMCEQVKRLKNGENVSSPVYDFSSHTRSSETIYLKSKPIIVIDGILIFTNPELREMMDMKIYVEVDADERVLRRVRRDVVKRGRDIDGVIKQYLETVKPMHNMYVEPTKKYADIIVNGGKNEAAFGIVKAKIEKLLGR